MGCILNTVSTVQSTSSYVGSAEAHRLSSMQQRSGPRARAAARKRAARARAREARGLLANEALGERRCIFLVSDVLSSDPLEIDSRTPGPGRADRRLGLVARRSAQSRLAGHHLQQLLVVEGEDDVEVVEERFCLRTRDSERD